MTNFTIYGISCIVSLVFFVYSNWYDGRDLELPSLFGMIIISAIPCINIFVAVACLFTIVVDWMDSKKWFEATLIKGRKL